MGFSAPSSQTGIIYIMVYIHVYKKRQRILMHRTYLLIKKNGVSDNFRSQNTAINYYTNNNYCFIQRLHYQAFKKIWIQSTNDSTHTCTWIDKIIIKKQALYFRIFHYSYISFDVRSRTYPCSTIKQSNLRSVSNLFMRVIL